MADTPETVGIAAVATAFMTVLAEIVRNARGKKEDKTPTPQATTIPPKSRVKSDEHTLHAIAAQLGSLMQRLHDQEQRMTRQDAVLDKIEQSIDGIEDAVNQFALKYERSNAGIQRDVIHLQDQFKELREQLKERKP
jgi:chromosome segregation ATPase